MITLTEKAASQLRNLLAQKDLPEQGLRVSVQAGGCAGLQYAMSYEDKAGEGDLVVEDGGIRLFVDAFSSRFLHGACIDFQDSEQAIGFRVDNPNAIASCACGISFRTEGSKEVDQICEP
jgi:iron-sulfur cluster assembly protein